MPDFTTDQLLCLQTLLINDTECSEFEEYNFTDVAEMEYLAHRAQCLEIIRRLTNEAVINQMLAKPDNDALTNLERGLS